MDGARTWTQFIFLLIFVSCGANSLKSENLLKINSLNIVEKIVPEQLNGERCEVPFKTKNPDLKTISVVTFNVLKDYGIDGLNRLQDIINILDEIDADLVSLQETYWDNSNPTPDAILFRDLLRKRDKEYWYFDSGQMLSKFPRGEIYKTLPFSRTRGWEIKGPNNLNLMFYNSHLTSDPFGPEVLEDTGNFNKAINNIGTTKRMADINAIISHSASTAGSDWPVIVTGDFNSASHLDWHRKNLRFVINDWPSNFLFFPWRESLRMYEEGFVDSFREANPDTKKNGYTYDDNLYELVFDRELQANTTKERIDYIFYQPKSKIRTLCSQVIGESIENADIVYVPWPSDHRAVYTVFEVLD